MAFPEGYREGGQEPEGELECPSQQPRVGAALPGPAAVPPGPPPQVPVPLGAVLAACQVDSGCLAFACRSARVPWQLLELVPASLQGHGDTWWLRTEPRGAHGEYGERCAWHRDGARTGQVRPEGSLWGQVVMVWPSCGPNGSARFPCSSDPRWS